MAEIKEAAPIHPVEARISIGGNDWQYVQRVLEELLVEFSQRHGRLANQASGGWDGSHSVTVATRDISADDYRAELDAWFHRGRQTAVTPA